MMLAQQKEISGYPLILGYICIMLILIGAITLLPLITLLFYPQDIDEAKYVILPGVLSILLGYLLSFTIRGKPKGKLHHNQDAIIVVVCWILAIFVTAMPFVLSQKYSLTQGLFEMSSAWSTTGLSVVDVTHTSHLFLMHRSLVLFFGGVGLVLVMCSVLSDTYGMRLYHAEGHNDRLLPNLIKSARIIITIYLCYTIAGTLLYYLYGMPLFDALIHSIGALSTGGFSSQPDSIAHYNSLPIEVITMLLMLVGNINFLAHLYLIKGKHKAFFQYCEIRFSLILLLITIPFFMMLLAQQFTLNMPTALRIASFQVISALTTTGFQTLSDFHSLSSALLMIMILLHLIGGGIGSTAGGIKQYRIYVLLKGIVWKLKEQLSCRQVIYAHNIRKTDQIIAIKDSDLSSIGIFAFLYLILFFLGSFLLSLYGYSLQDCMFEFSSALSTVGLSTGIMSYDAPAMVLWIGMFGMFFGRLEIYIILLAVLRGASDGGHWLKHKKTVIMKHKE